MIDIDFLDDYDMWQMIDSQYKYMILDDYDMMDNDRYYYMLVSDIY
jgi:hypothetical protein